MGGIFSCSILIVSAARGLWAAGVSSSRCISFEVLLIGVDAYMLHWQLLMFGCCFGYAFNLLHCCALLLGGGLARAGDMRPRSGSDDGMMQDPGGVPEGSMMSISEWRLVFLLLSKTEPAEISLGRCINRC
ncbi:hypothetical protein Nepgr_028349 [Nepenthes gracilis]|uniref:Secreted protein n=1 Tax=Nepenthes gracilis TaxID=150966 RepID=A0AAD3Y4F9_NEPGR|nr:hypothetical protein Nepgr_028349 [Nepenthes gracilis]